MPRKTYALKLPVILRSPSKIQNSFSLKTEYQAVNQKLDFGLGLGLGSSSNPNQFSTVLWIEIHVKDIKISDIYKIGLIYNEYY